MHLKSIELSGFKSFAKKSSLEFSAPISAIVGPNGSGKSNVAESFRFVLGEQSIKSMRGKRGEDLIWNGASGESRANRASVKVVFDNSDKLFSVDFPEVTVERVVHRDGVNEYLINGSKVRLKDVLELLAEAKIGSSGHHIISQGEADRALSASPRELKAFIEDALGLRIYQYKKVESSKKLQKVFENISKVESLRKEIAPHLKFLKKQVEKIEQAEAMRQELVSVGRKYFKMEEIYLKNAKTSIEAEKRSITESLLEISKELIKARQVLEDVGKQSKKEYLVLELESKIREVREEQGREQREIGRLEGSISAEEGVIRREREAFASEEHKTVRLKDLESLLREITSFNSAEKILERLKDFIRSKKNEGHSAVLEGAERRIVQLSSQKAEVEKRISALYSKENLLKEDYEELKRGIDKDKDSSLDAEKAVFRMMSEENELLSKQKFLEAKLESIKAEESEYKRELEEVAHLAGTQVLRFEEDEEMVSISREKQEERKREIQKLKICLEDSGVSGTEDVVKEYNETAERDQFLAKEILDLEESAKSLRELISELEEKLVTEFTSGVSKINSEFSELFKVMFGGGEAKLKLVKEKKSKSSDPFVGAEEEILEDGESQAEEGLEISINLPRKKIRGLEMLSGGERALTSIALIFAVSQVNPPPFIILDETDAALDESNSKKYGDLVEKLAERSQLILITHNRETMARAGVIYGVTMSSTGASKLLSIAFEEAVQVAK